MIQLAFISSIPHLRELSFQGEIEMALTPLVLTHPDYLQYYREQALKGRWVILDNGAFELEKEKGRGLEAEAVMLAARGISATEVICTDVLYDGSATVKATKKFLSYWKDHGFYSPLFMAVPQGRSIKEWMKCYDQLARLDEITSFGLSKLSVPASWGIPLMEARVMCAALVANQGERRRLHLLGGDNYLPLELSRQKANPLVRSNDSSMAFWYAAQGVGIDRQAKKALFEVHQKPELVSTQLTSAQLERAKENLSFLKECAA